MLTIRREQFSVFSHAEALKFENWMLTHLNRFFPKQCALAGEAQLRATIQYGIQRAAAYEINSSRDVCKYIDLMIVFGRDFDADGQIAWASRILNSGNSAGVRMNALMEAATLDLKSRKTA